MMGTTSWMVCLMACLCACPSISLAEEALRNHGCSPFADVLFIIDGSESITRMDFKKVQDYVKKEIQSLNIFPDGANIGVIVYSDDVSDTVSFKDNRDVENLERTISAIKQPRLGTNTAAALQEAGRMFQNQGRPGATQIAILITDGDTRDTAPPRAEAQRLKKLNVSIITIGVGNDAVQTELEAMASKAEYVKRVDSFAGLEMLKLPYLEVCPPGTTPPVGPFNPDDECEINGNVIFIFDGSESISRGEEQTMKRFIKNQIDLLKLGSGKAGMGLVVFSNQATEEIPLSNTVSVARLKSQVDGLRLPNRGSNIAAGIEAMRRMFERFGQPEKNRIAVLITDGVSIDRDETIGVARQAKDDDSIEIVAIGIGKEGQIDYEELKNIASSKELVFNHTSFDQFISTDFASKLSVGRECGSTSTVRPPTVSRTIQTFPSTSWTTRRTPSTFSRTQSSWFPPTTTRRSPPVRDQTTTYWQTAESTLSTRRNPVGPTPTIIGDPNCDNCRILYGSGFARHPDSCEKFIRCVLEPLSDGRFRAISSVVFDCPRGLFWDQEDSLTCRYPNEVNCPLDRCRTERGLKAYGDPTDCAVYWVCSRGVSMYKRCCEAGYRFDDSREECVQDNTCSSLFCQVGTGGGVCHFKSNPDDETWFFTNVNGVSVGRQCGAGLAFVQETCGCHRRIALPTQRVVDGCQPDAYLPFDEDVLDHSGWDRAVGHSGVEIDQPSGAVGGGAGKFDGTVSAWIYRYNNIEFPPYVEIRFRFQELPQASGRGTQPEALVTNGNCGDEPSIAVSSQRNSDQVTFFTETKNGVATTQIRNRDGWTDVTYIYDRTAMTGALGSVSPQSETLNGIIRRTHSPLIIGHGQGFQNFTGYVDEFYVYFCKP